MTPAQTKPADSALTVQVQQPQPQPNWFNSVLVDGASGAILLTCFVGIAKMVTPAVLGGFRNRQDESIKAQSESRKSELEIEAATAATMRLLLEQNTVASLAMNHDTLEVLSGHLASTLDAVVSKLAELSGQLNNVSETQAQISATQNQIANTQIRTLELLASIEASVRTTQAHSAQQAQQSDKKLLPAVRTRHRGRDYSS